MNDASFSIVKFLAVGAGCAFVVFNAHQQQSDGVGWVDAEHDVYEYRGSDDETPRGSSPDASGTIGHDDDARPRAALGALRRHFRATLNAFDWDTFLECAIDPAWPKMLAYNVSWGACRIGQSIGPAGAMTTAVNAGHCVLAYHAVQECRQEPNGRNMGTAVTALTRALAHFSPVLSRWWQEEDAEDANDGDYAADSPMQGVCMLLSLHKTGMRTRVQPYCGNNF